MKILPVIITRYNSSRLPGKSLFKINNKTILELIFNQIIKIKELEEPVVAMSKNKTDDKIYYFCKKKNYKTFRGNLNNVARRILDVGIKFKCPYVLRLNADSPYIDLELVKSSINKKNFNKYFYHSNIIKRSYPKGISLEIFNIEYLKKKILKNRNNKYALEHVSPLFLNDKKDYKLFKNYKLKNFRTINWTNNITIDTLNDFKKISKLLSRINILKKNFNWQNSKILLSYLTK